MRDNKTLHLELLRDRFAMEQPIEVSADGESISLTIEKASDKRQPFGLRISGLPQGSYHLSINDQREKTFKSVDGKSIIIEATVGKLKSYRVKINKEG